MDKKLKKYGFVNRLLTPSPQENSPPKSPICVFGEIFRSLEWYSHLGASHFFIPHLYWNFIEATNDYDKCSFINQMINYQNFIEYELIVNEFVFQTFFVREMVLQW